MLPSLISSLPQYPAASYQHASHYPPDGNLQGLFPTSLAIRVAVRGDNGLHTVQAMPITPGIRSEDLIHQILFLCGTAMNHRLLNILLMRRIVICTVVLSMTSDDSPAQLIQSIAQRSVHEPLTGAIYNPASLRDVNCVELFEAYAILPHRTLDEEAGKTVYRALMLNHEVSLRHALIWTFIAVTSSIIFGIVGGFATPHWDLNVALSVSGGTLTVLGVIQSVLLVAQ